MGLWKGEKTNRLLIGVDFGEHVDFVLTYAEWVEFVECEDAFSVSSMIPQRRRDKVAIVLANGKIFAMDAADWDTALKLMKDSEK